MSFLRHAESGHRDRGQLRSVFDRLPVVKNERNARSVLTDRDAEGGYQTEVKAPQTDERVA